MSKPRRDPAVTRQQWAERVDRFRRSGLTVTRFCDAEGVSEASFYVWKRTLAAEAITESRTNPPGLPKK